MLDARVKPNNITRKNFIARRLPIACFSQLKSLSAAQILRCAVLNKL